METEKNNNGETNENSISDNPPQQHSSSQNRKTEDQDKDHEQDQEHQQQQVPQSTTASGHQNSLYIQSNSSNVNLRTSTPRTEQTEKTQMIILEKVFNDTAKHPKGLVDKSMLPPSVCRSETMKLWKDVLGTKKFSSIKKISLRWCAIQSPGAKLLSEGLFSSCMGSLETLDLMGNEIGVSGTKAISNLLAPGVDLDSFQATDAKLVLSSFEGTKRIGCLKTLILSYNCTSDPGCGYIGKGLALSNTLERLELENCDIGDNGCKYLRRGIERSNTLKILNIAANRFGEAGSKEIQSFLIRNNSLEKLDISRNRLGATRTTDIAKGLTLNHSLKILRMNINRIGARGAQVLAKMLINNHVLEQIDLSYNEIFNDGVQVLAQGLVQNHGLKRIILWYNGLEDSAARQIARALNQRAKLTHFRNDMVQSIAESHPELFYVQDKNDKLRPNPETFSLCEKIIDFIPIFMHFEIDLSHNRRITKTGINSLLEVSNSDVLIIRGLKEMLGKDRKDREAAALARTSLY